MDMVEVLVEWAEEIEAEEAEDTVMVVDGATDPDGVGEVPDPGDTLQLPDSGADGVLQLQKRNVRCFSTTRRIWKMNCEWWRKG